MELTINQRLFYFFPLFFCFCLPFGSRLLSFIIAAWVVASFFNFNTANFIKGLKQRKFWLPVSFFVLTCLSAVFSQNKTEALTAIEIKLSFLVFPFLFFCFNLPVELIKRCVMAFVSGCFFASAFLILRAVYFTALGEKEYFYYSAFSYLLHPSYFSMYLLLALIFTSWFLTEWYRSHKTVIKLLNVYQLIFVVTIFLCSSKLGLISLFMLSPVILIRKFKIGLNLRTLLYGVVGLTLTLVAAFFLIPQSIGRLNSIWSFSYSAIDKTTVESTAVRALIWKESANIVKQNVVFGTGVGDANDALYRAYENSGMTGAYQHKLNAHSQYFQTAIGLGLPGFALLIILTIGQLFISFRHKRFVYLIFLFLVVLNFLVESMLQTAAGVLFFTFFYCFFNVAREDEWIES